jgi:amino acid permease
MCSATLGAGALSLPYAFQRLGVVGGALAIAVTASAAHYSVSLLVGAITVSGAKSYEELTVYCFGKTMGFVVEVNILVFCFGSVIAYTVAVGDLLEPVLLLKPVQDVAPWLDRQVVMCLFWAACMLPLSLVERLSALQCSSLLGVLSLFYLVLSVVAHALISRVYGHTDDLDAAAAALYGRSDGVYLLTLSWGSLEAFSIIMFAFTMQVNVPSLFEELPQRTPRRMSIVSGRCMALCATSYMLVGLAGYRDAPKSPNGNLLGNYCVTSSAPTSRMMQVAFVAMALSVVMAFPLNIHPCRYTLDVLICGRFSEVDRTVRHVGWTLFIAGSGLLIALHVPGINIVFQLMGSTSSAFVCFVLPAVFGLHLDLPETRGLQNGLACRALLLGGAALGITATAVTIITMLNGDDGPRQTYEPCKPLQSHPT